MCSRPSARMPWARSTIGATCHRVVGLSRAGACGGQYTANTMAMVMEFIGLCAMGSGSVPAVDGVRMTSVGRRATRHVTDREDRRPSDILSRDSFENAIVSLPPPADPPTPSCIFWPWHVKRASAEHRRLRSHQRQNAHPRRSQARRSLRRGRRRPGGRHTGPGPEPRAVRSPRCAPGRYRDGPLPRKRIWRGNARPGRDPASLRSPERYGRLGDSQGQPRARGMRCQDRGT